MKRMNIYQCTAVYNDGTKIMLFADEDTAHCGNMVGWSGNARIIIVDRTPSPLYLGEEAVEKLKKTK